MVSALKIGLESVRPGAQMRMEMVNFLGMELWLKNTQ
jgi:hypothetical protein